MIRALARAYVRRVHHTMWCPRFPDMVPELRGCLCGRNPCPARTFARLPQPAADDGFRHVQRW